MKLISRNKRIAAALVAFTLGLVSNVPGQDINLDQGLQAHWTFDETSGLIAADSTDNGNDGDLIDFIGDDSQWVAGQVGGAVAFDGTAYIEVPDSPSISGDLADGFTISVWFRSNIPLAANAANNANRMLEKSNAYFFLPGIANGGMNFLVKAANANRTAGIGQAIEADTWYNITGVYDGAEARVYLDGELKGQVATVDPIDVTDLPLFIGSDDSGNRFQGAMDDLRIWNRVLDDLEIMANAGLNVTGPPNVTQQPVAQTRFEGATGRFSVAADGEEPLRYLWYRNDESLRTETEAELTLLNLTPADAGLYKVRVQNDAGEVFSDEVELEVIPVEDITTGMQARWHFDETTGLIAADDSGNDNNAELFGFVDETAHWVEGRVGNALAFDGVTAVASAFDSESLNDIGDEATFSFWINPASYGIIESAGSYDRASAWILSKGNHFSVRIVDDPGSVRFTLVVRGQVAGAAGGGVARAGWEVSAPQNSLDLDEWQHWAIQYRAGQVFFYKNGFRIGDPVDAEIGAPDPSVDLAIGNFDNLGNQLRYFQGMLDEVGIWARPLSEAEILEMAGKDVSGAPAVEIQPSPLKRLEGTTASFEVQVTGKRPVAFQWLFNGEPIEGATGSVLTLTRLRTDQAGDYSVRITNEVGESTSEPASLTVESLDAITSGLVAYYPFDDATGTTLTDASGNGLDGILKDMDEDAWVAGQIGGAVRFDGIDDYIEIAHNDLLNMTSELSVSVWLNPYGMSSANHDRVIRKDTNFDFVLLPNGVLRTYGIIKTPYDGPAGSWEFDTWDHFTYVYKNDTLQWFKNGQAITEPVAARIGEVTTAPLTIGNYQSPPGSVNRPYLGTIDDLGIWQRALSAVEIDGIYQNGLNGNPLTEEFEPLNIRTLAVDAQIDLTFYSPFGNRTYGILRKDTLTDPWVDQADVQITEMGDGMFSASFPLPETGIGFFQVAAFEPPPLFFDDFESGGDGWTHGGDQDNWELGVPTTGPGAAFSGENVYATGLAANLGPFTDSFLRSPVIDLTPFTRQATLSFAEWLNIDEVDFHQAVVNILDADSMVPIQIEAYIRGGQTADWEEVSFRLRGDNLGQRIIVEFRVLTDDFNLNEGWFIDDVKVVAE